MKRVLIVAIVCCFFFTSHHQVLATIGDVNKDGRVDEIDWLVVMGAAVFERDIQGADINEDGRVDETDLLIIQSQFDFEAGIISLQDEFSILFRSEKGNYPGDINDDGVVNVLDLSLIGTRWSPAGKLDQEQLDAGFSEASRRAADLNGDGFVDKEDVVICMKYFGRAYFPTAEIITLNPGPQEITLKTLLANLTKLAAVQPQGKITTWGRVKK